MENFRSCIRNSRQTISNFCIGNIRIFIWKVLRTTSAGASFVSASMTYLDYERHYRYLIGSSPSYALFPIIFWIISMITSPNCCKISTREQTRFSNSQTRTRLKSRSSSMRMCLRSSEREASIGWLCIRWPTTSWPTVVRRLDWVWRNIREWKTNLHSLRMQNNQIIRWRTAWRNQVPPTAWSVYRGTQFR